MAFLGELMTDKSSLNSYPEKLAKWINSQKGSSSRYKKHLVAFLAIKDDVKAALDTGHTMKNIWLHMRAEGKISFSYKSFTQYVHRYLKENDEHKENRSTTDTEKKECLKQQSNKPVSSEEKNASAITAVFKIDHTSEKGDFI